MEQERNEAECLNDKESLDLLMEMRKESSEGSTDRALSFTRAVEGPKANRYSLFFCFHLSLSCSTLLTPWSWKATQSEETGTQSCVRFGNCVAYRVFTRSTQLL
jgi:hypothetical protein